MSTVPSSSYGGIQTVSDVLMTLDILCIWWSVCMYHVNWSKDYVSEHP